MRSKGCSSVTSGRRLDLRGMASLMCLSQDRDGVRWPLPDAKVARDRHSALSTGRPPPYSRGPARLALRDDAQRTRSPSASRSRLRVRDRLPEVHELGRAFEHVTRWALWDVALQRPRRRRSMSSCLRRTSHLLSSAPSVHRRARDARSSREIHASSARAHRAISSPGRRCELAAAPRVIAALQRARDGELLGRHGESSHKSYCVSRCATPHACRRARDATGAICGFPDAAPRRARGSAGCRSPRSAPANRCCRTTAPGSRCSDSATRKASRIVAAFVQAGQRGHLSTYVAPASTKKALSRRVSFAERGSSPTSSVGAEVAATRVPTTWRPKPTRDLHGLNPFARCSR